MQTKSLLLPVVCSFVVAMAGCSSADDDQSIAGPPPSEATIFVASAATTSDLGIAKWGFATDDAGDVMTYRGYGAHNEVLATVEQKLDRNDPNVYHYTLSMTGPSDSASEKIDFSTVPSPDGTQTYLQELVTDNMFDDGAVPSRVLAAFKADAAVRGSTTIGSGSLTGQSHTLDQGQQLVTNCNQTTSCQSELIDARIAAAGASSDCSLTKTVGQPLLYGAGAAGATALGSWWSGPFSVAATVIAGVGTAVTSGVVNGISCLQSRSSNTQAQNALKQCQQQAAMRCSGGS